MAKEIGDKVIITKFAYLTDIDGTRNPWIDAKFGIPKYYIVTEAGLNNNCWDGVIQDLIIQDPNSKRQLRTYSGGVRHLQS